MYRSVCVHLQMYLSAIQHSAQLTQTSPLFVSAEQGKVLKVLHTSEGVFIISQYSLFHNEGPVLNMAIDSQKV